MIRETILELLKIRGSMMRPNWPKLASLAQKTSTLQLFSFLKVCLLSLRLNP